MVTTIDLVGLFQDMAMTTLKVVAPLLIVALGVGLLISIFQAATQINEQTLTFVPKLVAIALVLLFAGSWMMQLLMAFTYRVFELMTGTL